MGRSAHALTAPASPARPAPRRAGGLPRGRLLVVGVLALLAGLALGSGAVTGLMSSTETRYAEIGREMRVSGDLVVPTLNGAPHLEKPPFTYWALAGAFLVAGVNDVAARLPSLLAGLLTLFVVAGVVRRLGPEDDVDPRGRGRTGALVLATMPAFFVQASTVSTDAWLVLCVTVACAAVLESVRHAGRPGWGWTLALHAALGVGMIVKGPVVFVAPLLGALAAAIARRTPGVLRPWGNPVGLLLLVGLAAPWYLAANVRLPGLLRLYVEQRVVDPVLSHEVGHGGRGAWVLWAPILLGTAPWIGGVYGAVTAFLRDPARRRFVVPLAAFALAHPVFFTFSTNRLASYASPALPWIAALVAAGAPTPGALEDEAGRRWRRHLAYASIVTGLVLLGLPWAGLALGKAGVAHGLAYFAAIVALLALAPGFPRATLSAPAPRALALGVAVVAGLAGLAMSLPELLAAHRPVAELLAAKRAPSEPVGVAIHKDGEWALVPFYLGEPATFFGYQGHLGVAPPASYAPDRFRPIEDVTAWFAGPGRRWLVLRTFVKNPTNDVWRRLEALPHREVGRFGRYSVVVNEPR